MSQKTQTRLQVARTIVDHEFDEIASKDDIITAEQHTALISKVCDREYSSKTVRARLRRKFTRADELKNAAWRITRTLSASDLSYYMKQNDVDSEQALKLVS